MCGERYSTGSFGSTETEGMVLKRKSRANKQKKTVLVCVFYAKEVWVACVSRRVSFDWPISAGFVGSFCWHVAEAVLITSFVCPSP